MMILHIERYLFITLSVTLTYFKVTAVSNRFRWKCCSFPITFQLCQVLNIYIFFFFFLISKIFSGDSWRVFWFDRNFIVGFFMDTLQARFFKLCIIIFLLWVYQFIPGLKTLTLFQGHRCVRIKTTNYFGVLLHRSLNVVWFLYISKISVS